MIDTTKTTINPATTSRLPERFSAVARTLHWLVAGGIVVQYLLAELAEKAADRGEQLTQLAVLANHKSMGITLLVLVAFRLLWRSFNRPPPRLPDAQWARHTARITQGLLYALLVLLPLSGWLMSSAKAYSVSWFNLVQLPDLIAAGESASQFWSAVHHYAGEGLLVLAALHILAALKHYLIDKDSVMARMATAPGLIAFALLAVGGVWALGTPAAQQITTQATAPPVAAAVTIPEPTPTPSTPETPSTPTTAAVRLDAWVIDYEASHIRFTATQAGATFEGRWLQWEADVYFDPEHLSDSRAEVRIQAANVSTGDEERDATLATGDWFDSTNFTSVVFATQHIESIDTGYHADANLTIRGVSYPIGFDFELSTSASGDSVLTGTSELDRLALGLGVVEWADTQWVGQTVEVSVRLVRTLDAAPSR